jgi:transcriptional repressor NrdR
VRVEKLVSGIQRQLETSGEGEVSSKRIGEMVMEGLKRLDSVAYIRFASVYREFGEAKDFEAFAGTVEEVAPKGSEFGLSASVGGVGFDFAQPERRLGVIWL